jgi:hypothetical protein
MLGVCDDRSGVIALEKKETELVTKSLSHLPVGFTIDNINVKVPTPQGGNVMLNYAVGFAMPLQLPPETTIEDLNRPLGTGSCYPPRLSLSLLLQLVSPTCHPLLSLLRPLIGRICTSFYLSFALRFCRLTAPKSLLASRFLHLRPPSCALLLRSLICLSSSRM